MNNIGTFTRLKEPLNRFFSQHIRFERHGNTDSVYYSDSVYRLYGAYKKMVAVSFMGGFFLGGVEGAKEGIQTTDRLYKAAFWGSLAFVHGGIGRSLQTGLSAAAFPISVPAMLYHHQLKSKGALEYQIKEAKKLKSQKD